MEYKCAPRLSDQIQSVRNIIIGISLIMAHKLSPFVLKPHLKGLRFVNGNHILMKICPHEWKNCYKCCP